MSKRKDLTLKEKIAILDQIKSLPPGTSQRKISELLKIPKTTIARLQKESVNLRELANTGKSATTKRHRDGKNPEVEEALSMWFKARTEQGVALSGPLLMAKANEIAKELGHAEFDATTGWLNRWKVRNQIVYKRLHGEKNSADVLGAQEWIDNKLPTLLENYAPSDIYNADETGLYYRATPDGHLCYSYASVSGSKKSMDRFTVLCCTNMDGSDKLRLLVIGKSKKPRCFSGINVDKLPVLYKSNKNAWMTAAIFEEWLRVWDKILRLSGRSILLLVDNCSAHPKLDLSNIRLEFLPPNTTSIIQPLDQGVIRNLKLHYRSELVKLTLNHLESGDILPSASATSVSSKVTILEAIQLVAKSWKDVKPETIANCFRKGGFVLNSTVPSVIDDNEPTQQLQGEDQWAVLSVSGYENYTTIDENLTCYDESTDNTCTDDIIEHIVAKRPCLSEDSDEDNDNDDLPMPPVDHKSARTALQTLKGYMLQQGIDMSSSLYTLQDNIDRSTILKPKIQVKLDNFVQFN
jgi:hypothetical protein